MPQGQTYLQYRILNTGRKRSFREVLNRMGSWAGAGVFAYYVLKWHRGDTRYVDHRKIASEDAAEFEMLQAKTNSTVKERDRQQAFATEERTSMLHSAARAQKDKRDIQLDYMTDYKNTIGVDGVVRQDITSDAQQRVEWMDKHGNADFEQELENLKESLKRGKK
eukprot:TRINITY_DN5326_c0_g2_i1.p1 TRINITY_DN5326_c0_g2~~TRINITY_DN5326_c0_g2_i1.p1  ORF type:complete len:165 (+),score=45.82 TRINITY_DN5326_c0_g2_i1:64-558(+)